MTHKAKITVLKKVCSSEFNDLRIGDSVAPCRYFEYGQEFVIDRPDRMPDGFCHWAWSDIHEEVKAILDEDSFPLFQQSGSAIACCSDGFKPVTFRIERVAE